MPVTFTAPAQYLRIGQAVVDVSGDFTVFGYGNRTADHVGFGQYQTLLALFTGAEDYSDPYLWVGLSGLAGTLIVQTLGGTVSTDIPALGTWAWFAITYRASDHLLTFILDGVVIGTTTYDFSGTPFTSAVAGGDVAGTAQSDVSVYTIRAFASILSIPSLQAEAQSVLAIATAVMDTPLSCITDLLDYTGNGNTWVVTSSPQSDFSGPYAVAGRLAVIFEKDQILFLTPELQPVSQSASIGDVRCAAAHPDGTVSVLTGSGSPGTITFIRHIDPATGAVSSSFAPDQTIVSSQGRVGSRVIMHRPSGDLLIASGSGLIIRMRTNGTTIRTYSLAATDFAINLDGTRLLYVDGDDLKIWNLATDSDGGTWRGFGAAVHYPVWLSDCSVVCCTGDGESAVLQRVRQTGDPLATYANPSGAADFDEWPNGLAADLASNRVWALADWDASPFEPVIEAIYLRSYNLETGALLSTVYWPYEDFTDSVGQIIYLAGSPCSSSASIPTLRRTTPKWMLQRFDVKPRGEQSA